jgi:hypothetical protein
VIVAMLVSRAIFVAALAFALVVSDVDRSCQVAGLFALATLLEQRAHHEARARFLN